MFYFESANTYARIHFVDFSSACNTVIPGQLFVKLKKMGAHVQMWNCKWVLDFVLGRSQVVKVSNMFPNPPTVKAGAPHGCVLSVLLGTLFTNDCISSHDSVLIFKFSDDIIIACIIRNSGDNREEVERMVDLSDVNNVEPNASNTKEMIIDLEGLRHLWCLWYWNMTLVQHFKFLGLTIII